MKLILIATLSALVIANVNPVLAADSNAKKFGIISLKKAKSNDADSPHPLAPEPRVPKESYAPILDAAPGDLVTAAVIGAVVVAAKIMSVESPREDIQGTCGYSEKHTQASYTPCVHVNVELLNENNQPVATVNTNNDGDFRFYVPKDKKYRIRIADRKGRTATVQNLIGRGSVVSLTLTP